MQKHKPIQTKNALNLKRLHQAFSTTIYFLVFLRYRFNSMIPFPLTTPLPGPYHGINETVCSCKFLCCQNTQWMKKTTTHTIRKPAMPKTEVFLSSTTYTELRLLHGKSVHNRKQTQKPFYIILNRGLIKHILDRHDNHLVEHNYLTLPGTLSRCSSWGSMGEQFK